MKQLAISLVAAFLVACPSPLGQPCNIGQCAVGYTCVVDVEMTSPTTSRYVPICARSCDHNTDCGPGVDCRLGNNNDDGRRFCNDFGTLEAGEQCENWGDLRGCGPGLSCHRYLQTCVPTCNIDSTQIAERQCPSGTTCNASERSFDDSMRTISPWAYCREQCDLADPVACRTGFVCRRWTSPGIGEVATCEITEFERSCPSGISCPAGEICQDNTCYAPADARPRRPDEWFPPLSAPTE